MDEITDSMPHDFRDMSNQQARNRRLMAFGSARTAACCLIAIRGSCAAPGRLGA